MGCTLSLVQPWQGLIRPAADDRVEPEAGRLTLARGLVHRLADRREQVLDDPPPPGLDLGLRRHAWSHTVAQRRAARVRRRARKRDPGGIDQAWLDWAAVAIAHRAGRLLALVDRIALIVSTVPSIRP